METTNKNYADELQKLGIATTTADHYEEMLCCLPPQLTNFEKNRGFDAFLVGEPYSHRFCKIAKKEVAFYECFARTSNGAYLKAGLLSEAGFTKFFINKDF